MDRRSDIKLPEFLNGAEERYLHLHSEHLDSATETVRRMQDLYQCISAGRYNLLRSKLRSYPNLLEHTKYGNNYIRSIYLNNAIHWYNAAFDLLLQVVWFNYRLYEKYSLSLNNAGDFDAILDKCRIKTILKEISIVPSAIIEVINELDIRYSVCREWTNTLKHRRFIRYHELEPKRKAAYITLNQRDGESLIDALQRGDIAYNSMETELSLSMSQVKNTLVLCHKALYNAAAVVVETIGYWPDNQKKQLYRINSNTTH